MTQRSRRRTRPNPLLKSALEYADSGMRVFPLVPRTKQPLIKGWPRVATNDPGRVGGFWQQQPAANIGVCCGHGVVVVDADSRDAEAAVLDLGLPDTPRVQSARGSHFYFAGASRNRQALLPGVDIRGQGGYVVGAESVHPCGAKYEWIVSLTELAPQPLPEALKDLLGKKKEKPNSRQPETDLTAEGLARIGYRNTTLTRMAGTLKRRGFNDSAIEQALLAQNETGCEEPLPLHEINAICRSASAWPQPPIWLNDPFWFSHDPSLAANERLVLIALSGHSKHNGWCYASYRRIGLLTGLNKNVVMKAVNALESMNWIGVKRGGPGKANWTTILKGRGGDA